MTSTSELKSRQVLVLILLIIVCIVVPYGRSIVVITLLPLALVDRNKALFALIAIFLVRMTNTAIAGSDPLLATAAWMTSLAAATRVWLDFVLQGRRKMPRHLRLLTVYVLVALVLSVIGLSPTVSFLKALAFFYIAGAILVGITSQVPTKATISTWLYAVWASILIASLVTLAIPEVGYFRDGQGFQGALSHPQALGIFLAPLLAFLLARSFRTRKIDLRNAGIIILVISMLLLTRARTGIVSILMGSIILVFLRAGAIRACCKWLARSRTSLVIFPMILLMGPMLYSELREGINEYIFKSASSQSLGTAFEESRGFLILQAINNIKNHPITGIGFGVASSETHEFIVELDPLTGLPIGAPTEKANIIIAVLEETGIVGIVAFSIFFLSFLRVIANSGSVGIAWSALASVCTNISEMTFFSMGGFGTYTWIICAIAIALAPPQYRYTRRRRTALSPVGPSLDTEITRG